MSGVMSGGVSGDVAGGGVFRGGDSRLLIVGIHGLSNKPLRDRLSEFWRASIDEGLARYAPDVDDVAIEMVYWADLLYRYPLHEDEALSFDPYFNDEPYVASAQQRGGGDGRAKGGVGGWMGGVMDWGRDAVTGGVGRLFDFGRQLFGPDRVARLVIERSFRDLYFYDDANRLLRGRDGRVRVASAVLRDELREVLMRHAGRRVMLISHSMGSIIAYDVLRELEQVGDGVVGGQVVVWVTIGSPLGLSHVKGRLVAEHGDDGGGLRTPEWVTGRWVNLADRGDAVALDGRLRDDYSENDGGVRVEDFYVTNDYRSPVGKRNRHKSYGYLRCQQMAELVRYFSMTR